jgi:hypothetical protein
MVAAAVLAALAAVSSTSTVDTSEESPDVFLAKAALQQYLSRVVRKDWDGARRLTHPKTLAAIAQLKKRTGSERHDLAPWADSTAELKTFHFTGTRQVAAGMVMIEVGEDSYHAGEQDMSVDEPAVYLMFKAHGSFLVGDKKEDARLSKVPVASVQKGYPGYIDKQVQAQARRESGLHEGRHR